METVTRVKQASLLNKQHMAQNLLVVLISNKLVILAKAVVGSMPSRFYRNCTMIGVSHLTSAKQWYKVLYGPSRYDGGIHKNQTVALFDFFRKHQFSTVYRSICQFKMDVKLERPAMVGE